MYLSDFTRDFQCGSDRSRRTVLPRHGDNAFISTGKLCGSTVEERALQLSHDNRRGQLFRRSIGGVVVNTVRIVRRRPESKDSDRIAYQSDRLDRCADDYGFGHRTMNFSTTSANAPDCAPR